MLQRRLNQKIREEYDTEIPLNLTYTDFLNVQKTILIHSLVHRCQHNLFKHKKLTTVFDFNCEQCSKSIANTLLRIKCLIDFKDYAIRIKVL